MDITLKLYELNDESLKGAKMLSQEKLDHPCRATCSGWQQGYDKGKSHADKIKSELDEVRLMLSQFDIHSLKEREEREALLKSRLEKCEALLKEMSPVLEDNFIIYHDCGDMDNEQVIECHGKIQKYFAEVEK